jgi:TPR repeat protein
VADFYHVGMAVPANKKLALEYYKSAAELGNPEAMVNLAFIYE